MIFPKKERPKKTTINCINCSKKLLDFELVYGQICTKCNKEKRQHATPAK